MSEQARLSAETVRTPLTCGHYFPGLHHGPHAWCRECLDFAMIGYPPDQFDGGDA